MADLPKYLRHDPDGFKYANNLITADLDSGFSVGGKGIKESPNEEDDPAGYAGALRMYRGGIVVEATQAEWDEAQAQRDAILDPGSKATVRERLVAEVRQELIRSGAVVVLERPAPRAVVEDFKPLGQLQPGEEEDDEWDGDEDRVADVPDEVDNTVHAPLTSSFDIPGYSDPPPSAETRRRKKKVVVKKRDSAAQHSGKTGTETEPKGPGGKVT